MQAAKGVKSDPSSLGLLRRDGEGLFRVRIFPQGFLKMQLFFFGNVIQYYKLSCSALGGRLFF